MFEFRKKTVDENAIKAALYGENSGGCKNQGICDSHIDGVCGV